MEQTLSSSVAPAAFGTALLCAGQLSTFTGTIAGQVGFGLACFGGLVVADLTLVG